MSDEIDETPWDAPAILTSASGATEGLTLKEALQRYMEMGEVEREGVDIRLEHPHVSGALDEEGIRELVNKLQG